jgi:uncharacterized phage-like protein YoqJ
MQSTRAGGEKSAVNRYKTMKLAVTGHRKLPKSFDELLLKKELSAFVHKGYDTFFIGMALGFDTACFRALVELKKEGAKVKLVACVPCANQDIKFTEKQKAEYRKLLSQSDEVHVLGEVYGATAMMRRNRFMVDHADTLYAFLEKQRGGAYNTVRYARDKGKPIVFYGVAVGEPK